MDPDTLYASLKAEQADQDTKSAAKSGTAAALAAAQKADSDAGAALDGVKSVKAKTLADLKAALDAKYGS